MKTTTTLASLLLPLPTLYIHYPNVKTIEEIAVEALPTPFYCRLMG